MDRIIGIDLGTTNSAVGWIDATHPHLLQVDGQRLCPSVVSFPAPGEILVGSAARNRLALDPQHTVRSAKRHMGSERCWSIHGQSYGAPEVQAQIRARISWQRRREQQARFERDLRVNADIRIFLPGVAY